MNKEFIKQVFRESGLSKNSFAIKARVTPKTVSNWLNGFSEPLFVNQKVIRSVFHKEIENINLNNKQP